MGVQKKMQAMESQFDVCTEDLFNQTIKLEEMEKKAGNAEGEVSSLRGSYPAAGEQRKAGGTLGQDNPRTCRRLPEGGREREEEDRAGERGLLQRGDHRQPRQAAGRVEGEAQ